MEIKENKLIVNAKKYWWIFLFFALLALGIGTTIFISESNNRKEAEKQAQKEAESIEREKKQVEEVQQKIKDQNGERKLTSAELAKAISILANGIVIGDGQNDFAIPVIAPDSKGDALGRTDNTKPYSLGWNDLKKVTFGSDAENFYIRYDFYGVIPEKMAKIGADEIKGIGGGVILQKFTTNSGKTNEGSWEIGVNWVEANDGGGAAWTNDYHEIPVKTIASGLASPGEKDQYNETRYNQGMAGASAGGAGYDYLIAVYPLAGLDVKPASEIEFIVTVETNSKIYHHSSIDPLLDAGSAKSGRVIHYVLCSNTYTTTEPRDK